jgi:hypothetical protein
MKVLACFLLVGAVAIFSTLPFASAQVSNGMRRGFACTDAEDIDPTADGHRVFEIPLDNPGQTVQWGLTKVDQELEGFFSVGARLYGVAETQDGTGLGGPSVLVDVTDAAVRTDGEGILIGETGVNFGTEAGGAYDPLTDKAYAIFSDDLTREVSGQLFPATKLVTLNLLTGGVLTNVSIVNGLHVDGLAVGHDGTLYATDARNTDSLYKYNFGTNTWDLVGGLLAENFNEDSGLGAYLGLNGDQTNLYMITEGDGANLGRLWTINNTTGEATLVGNITFGDGTEVPEDLEGFDIPFQALDGEQ